MRRALALTALFVVLAGGCGSLGKSGEWSPQVLNGGAGPFRLATREETGFESGTIGLMLDVSECVGRTQIAGDVLYYDAAPALAAPPVRNPALLGWQVDWAQYDSRSIYRSSVHWVDSTGVTRSAFYPGSPILAPSLAWESAGVFDPTILTLPSGAVRLFYATAQGIGVAEAPGLDGAFTRLVTTPILPDVAGLGAASSPAVALLPNGDTMLYVEAGGFIWAARAADGLAFTLEDMDTTTAAIDPLSLVIPPSSTTDVDAGAPDAGGMDASVATEVSVWAPSALTTHSETGRFLVRLYFESRRTDGTSVLAVAASFDGTSFTRSAIAPVTKNNPSHATAYVRPDGITLLTFVIARPGGGLISSIPLLGVSPSERALPAN